MKLKYFTSFGDIKHLFEYNFNTVATIWYSDSQTKVNVLVKKLGDRFDEIIYDKQWMNNLANMLVVEHVEVSDQPNHLLFKFDKLE